MWLHAPLLAPYNKKMASSKSNGLRPNPKQRQLLEVLNNGRLMDTPALHELLLAVYPKRNTLQVALHTLQQHGYVVQVAIATQPLTPHGRPAATWAMGRRGSLYLGTPIKNNQTLTPGFREHELMVSRTYAALEKGCRMLDGFALASWERNQKLPPLKPSGYEKEERYETDACSVVTRDTTPYRFYHEIDNKTEPAERHAEKWQSDFYRKVAHYQDLYRRRADLLGDGAMRVLTSVPTPGRLRGLQQLCRRTDPRKGKDEQAAFSMNTKPFEEDVDGTWRVAWSQTLRLFHGTITVTIIVVMVVVGID